MKHSNSILSPTNIKVGALIVFIPLSLVVFQNCSKGISFNEANKALKAESLTFISEDGQSSGSSGDGDDNNSHEVDIEDVETTDHGEMAPNNSGGESHDNSAHNDDPSSDPYYDSHSDEGSTDEQYRSQEDQLYRCVVEDKGQAAHIGCSSGKASVDQSTPQTLCMSKTACLDIMSQAFKVKLAKKTGYCKNGTAHTRSITDQEAEDLVKELLQR